MRARWIAACVGVVGTAGVAALSAVAQPPATLTPAPSPVLHEDVTSPGERGAAGRRTPAVLGREPAAGHNPTAIRDDEKILPEPEVTGAAQAESDEPVLGRGGFGADRRTESTPDYMTGGDEDLRYVEVFNPSVVPFKRMSALDAVREDYTLAIASTSLTDLEVTGQPTPGFDRFWGSMLVDLRPGEDVAIPSVAPGMKIVSYEVEPRTPLTFSVDSADNFYVRGDEPDATGVHRLVFLAEASPRHFAPSEPPRVRLADLPRALARPVPERVQRMAEQTFRKIGVHRDQTLDVALDSLVSYFRGFEAKTIPETRRGDVYYDLTMHQAGVCRHRAFAFMITANTLGIPTRFLSNEAHAWVEVWVPRARDTREGGWIRIDLGGAALSLEVKNADGKSMYRPRGEDPFPKPASYSENYTRLEGDISGLSQDQIAEARTPRARPTPAQPADGEGGASDGASDGGGAARAASGSADGEGEGGEGQGGEVTGDLESGQPGDPGPLAPGRGLPSPAAPAARDDKRPTAVVVTSASGAGFRGESVAIEGALTGEGAPLPGLQVVLYLAPAGRSGAGARVVGHAVTGPDGRFRADVQLPFDLELAEHEVFASTPGDERQQPAVSR